MTPVIRIITTNPIRSTTVRCRVLRKVPMFPADERFSVDGLPCRLDELLTEYDKPLDRSRGFVSSMTVHAAVLAAFLIVGHHPITRTSTARTSFTLIAPSIRQSARPVTQRPTLRPVRSSSALPRRTAAVAATPPRFTILPEPVPPPAAPVLIAIAVPASLAVLSHSARISEHPVSPSLPVEGGFSSPRVPAVVSSVSARVVPVTGFDSIGAHDFSSRTSPASAQIKGSGFGDSVSIQQIPVDGRGTLRTSGFSQLSPSTPGLNKSTKTVLESGFGKVTSGTSVAVIATKPAPAVIEVVQILQKPRPAYTEEARKLQIEGEVVLETIFTALGEVRVIRVLRGLGHGLDENAMAAARSIRFVPAQREGKSVDQAGTVRLTFQLAY